MSRDVQNICQVKYVVSIFSQMMKDVSFVYVCPMVDLI